MRTSRIAPGASVSVDLGPRPRVFIGRSLSQTAVSSWLNYRTPVVSSFNPLSLAAPLKAVWASDPLWTNPGNGNTSGTLRNAGSLSGDFAPQTGSKLGPVYRSADASFSSQPCWDFTSSDHPVETAAFTTQAVTYSHIVVGRWRANGATYLSLFDVASGANASSIFYDQPTVKSAFYAGTPQYTASTDTNAHSYTMVVKTSASVCVVDGSTVTVNPVGTNSVSTVRLGMDRLGTAANVSIAFYGLYAGDVSVHSDYSTLIAGLKTLYGTP